MIAPILVIVYNREEHFKKCIKSLKNCKLADKSHLFIAIDAPYKVEHISVHNRIVKYSKQIKGFKKLTLFVRDKNLGPNENSEQAKKEIFSQYDRLIFTEDDNIFSSDFLTFLNKGLEVYKDRPDIFSISGYKFPIKLPNKYNNDIFIWPGINVWGYGVWRDKWDKVDWSIDSVEKYLSNKVNKNELFSIAEHVHRHLVRIGKSGEITGDTMLSLYIFNNSMYSVFPSISRVRNIGHDEYGMHCGKSGAKIFHNQEIYVGDKEAEFPIDIMPDPRIYKLMKKYSQEKLKTKLKIIAKSTLRTLKLYNK